MFFRTIFRKKTKPVFDKMLTSGEVEYAFTSGGIDYFQFVNEQKIPPLRAFAAMDIYAEMEMRLSSEYLDALFKSIRAALNKGDLVEASSLLNRAETRKENISNSQLLYKLSSVRYFDANEDPHKYDDTYNFKKIQRWIASDDVESFFLKVPIDDLLPSFNFSETSFREYTNLERRQLMEHLTLFIKTLSEKDENKDTVSRLQSWMETLRQSVPYLEKEFTTTTSSSKPGLRKPEIKRKIIVGDD